MKYSPAASCCRLPSRRPPAISTLALCIALFASVAWSQSGGAARAAGQAGANLRLAAFNAKWLAASASESRMDPWREDSALDAHRRAVAGILATTRADVVCLVEVLSRPALDKLLAEPALRPLGYAGYHLESEDTGTGQDVAFLSRLPLDRVEGQWIRRVRQIGPGSASSDSGVVNPKGVKKKGRGKRSRDHAHLTKHALVYLTVGRLKLGLLGLHLLAHPDDAGRNRRRAAQAQAAARLIREEIVARGYVPVVLGDFNDFDPDVAGPAGFPDGRRRVLRLVKDFDSTRPGPELFNIATHIPLAKRYASYWDKDKDGRLDEGEPLSLIDHILLDSTLAPRLRKAEILHGVQDGSVSDHWPVVVELER